MAKKSNFKKKAKIAETEGSGFGEYKEYNGGGSPKGGVWGGKSGRVGWQQRVDSGEVGEGESRQDQPRDKYGHFTYNSVNGKETKYESRGKTVNPLLTGGDGTIKIEDVKKEFEQKSGKYWDKYKDSWYQKGSEKIVEEKKGKLVTKISAKDIWEIARKSWDVSKGEFGGESEVFSETKKGRSSAAELKAKKFAKKSKGEEYVQDEATGGIKKFKDKVTKSNIKNFMEAKNMEMPAKEPEKAPEKEPEKKFGSGKYTQKEADEVLQQIKNELGADFDASMWSDESTLEEFMDSLPKA